MSQFAQCTIWNLASDGLHLAAFLKQLSGAVKLKLADFIFYYFVKLEPQ